MPIKYNTNTASIDQSDAKDHAQNNSYANNIYNSSVLKILKKETIQYLQKKFLHCRYLQKNDFLFLEGVECRNVYIINQGSLKIYRTDIEGDEHIINFFIAQDMIGLSNMGVDNYSFSAQSLEKTTVCEMPLYIMEKLIEEYPEVRKFTMQLMSKKIREDIYMMKVLLRKTAEERLAILLINLANRYNNIQPKENYNIFRLPMSRDDISNYLGLASETISRTLTHFQKKGLLTFAKKTVHILNKSKLENLINYKSTFNNKY